MTITGSSLARSVGEGDRDVSAEARSAKAEAVEGADAHERFDLVQTELVRSGVPAAFGAVYRR